MGSVFVLHTTKIVFLIFTVVLIILTLISFVMQRTILKIILANAARSYFSLVVNNLFCETLCQVGSEVCKFLLVMKCTFDIAPSIKYKISFRNSF